VARNKAIRFALRWAALTLLGWLAYVLLRALWTMIDLGAQPYDWLWYLVLIGAGIGLPACLLWRRPCGASIRRMSIVAYVAFLIAAIVGYYGFGQVTHLDLGNAAPVRISFWTGMDFRHAPETLLKDLSDAGGRVYYGAGGYYPLEGDRREALAASIRRLAEFGVEVYLATPSGDNFLSVPVHQEWIASTQAAAAFVRREGLLNVRGFIGDAEPPLGLAPDILGAERAEFDRAVTAYRDAMATIRRDAPGLEIGVTAVWAHYVDRLDGDADLAVLMRSPVDPPGEWDFVNLMTYSSYFAPEQRAYSVYLLERAMARLYPAERVSHLIGLVGGGMPGEPLLDFDGLVRDARLSRALGVREAGVFQLDGALAAFGPDFVRRLSEAVNDPPNGTRVAVPFSRPISLAFFGIAAADAMLDILGSRAGLLIAWSIVSGWLARRG